MLKLGSITVAMIAAFCCRDALGTTGSGVSRITDSMTNAAQAGGIAGSHPDIQGLSATWTSYWLNNFTAASNTLTSPSASYPSTDQGGIPVTAVRAASGTTFTVNGKLVNNGAFIPLSPLSTDQVLIAKATVTFASTAANWACIGLEPNISVNSRPPDFYNSNGGVQMLVYPEYQGNYSEFYTNTVVAAPGANGTPFGTLAGTLNAIPSADHGVFDFTHTMMLIINRTNGQVTSWLDDALVGTGLLNSTNLSAFNNPTNMGMFIAVRGKLSGTTFADPASATFTNVQFLPEPGCAICAGTALTALAARRRRAATPV